MCVQEKGRLNQEKIEDAHLSTQEKKLAKKGKGKPKAPLNQVNKGIVKCFFCKKKGHIKKIVSNLRLRLKRKVISSL